MFFSYGVYANSHLAESHNIEAAVPAMNTVNLAVILLLLVATGLTWLVRWNKLIFVPCLLFFPLAPALVMVLFSENFPGGSGDLDSLRFALAVPVCYAIVWISLFAGWVSGKILEKQSIE
ncbi:MAG: hypothetical protein KDJ29_14560 [Hyphomicrobiales bacterium]|nr:hypothetical protein [Hyphomicrobiales bacterium]